MNPPAGDHLILSPPQTRPFTSNGNRDFFDRNWSFAWANFLLQEVGFYHLASLEDFKMEDLDSYRFVYLPSSLNGHLGKKDTARFVSFVESGGVLIVEGPVVNSIGVGSVRLDERPSLLKRITGVGAGPWPARLAEWLSQMPFCTRGWKGMSGAKNESQILLEMEGSPVFWKQSLGKGSLFTLGFDFGLLLTGLQQGIPADGKISLRKLFGTQTRVIEPEDLVLKASLLNNPFPWADLFERFLYQAIAQGRPAARWWYFPSNHTGAVFTTHDEEALGSDPRIQAMWEKEKAKKIRGTLFVISDSKIKERWSRVPALRNLAQEGLEIGLHWNRFKSPRWKLRCFKGGMHEDPLTEQIDSLQKLVGRRVCLNRTHYLALGKFYGEHFERLEKEKIALDSSYGPNQGGRGYLFGTGYPYYGMTGEGRLTQVLELPFVTQEMWGGADLDFLKTLIRESDENFHQCIVMSFHPHYKILGPEGLEMWMESLTFAQERGQWIPTLGEFVDFFEARRGSTLRTERSAEGGKIRFQALFPEASLAVPAEIQGGRKFSRAEQDGVKIEGRQMLNCGFEEVLIPAGSGNHEIEIFYEG